MYQGIDVLIEDNQPFHSPMNGQIVSVPDTETLVIEKEKVARLTIHGVNTLRLTKGMDVEEGTFLGNTKNSTVTFQYEKYKRNERLVFVNPAFYFPRVTYTQTTLLGSTDFSPGASVEKRAQAVYDYLSKRDTPKKELARF